MQKDTRTFVIGDIHGGYKALLQVLERANVTKEDKLIFLGDYVDGWSQSYEVIEKLLELNSTNECIFIRGNHDQWFYEYIRTGFHGSQWEQGAHATKNSYGKRSMMIPDTHEKFFGTQLNYYIDDQNRCFVHGGFNRHFSIKDQSVPYIYYWDRDLWMQALSYTTIIEGYPFKMFDKFKEVFIGHTSTTNWKTDKPMHAANIWNLDTGGGFKGKLTIMNVDTKEYFQSDLLTELYPDEKGRN